MALASVIFTIFTYSIIYGGAFIFFKSADRAASDSKRKYLVFAGIIYLSIFASVRDISVGTDTATTLQGYFGSRSSFPIIDVFSDYGGIFYLFSYVFQILHFGQKSILFCLELLILTPVAICAWMRRKQTPIYITMTLFLLLFYQVAFNWIRQSIACSFHASVLIGIAIFASSYLCIVINNRILKILCISMLFVVVILLFSQWDMIALWGIKVGILPDNYKRYVSIFTGEVRLDRWFGIGKRTYGDYFIRVLFVLIPIIYQRPMLDKHEKGNLKHYIMITIIALLIYSFVLFGIRSPYGNRITYTVEYVHLLNLGSCCSAKVHRKGIVPLRNLIIISVALLYNVWLYYVLGWHDTVPFYFAI